MLQIHRSIEAHVSYDEFMEQISSELPDDWKALPEGDEKAEITDRGELKITRTFISDGIEVTNFSTGATRTESSRIETMDLYIPAQTVAHQIKNYLQTNGLIKIDETFNPIDVEEGFIIVNISLPAKKA